MEEGDPGGGGQRECCGEMANTLRSEFEKKFKEIDDKMAQKERALLQYVDELKEIISVREEQVIATMAMVKEKEEVINELKGK